MASKKGSFLESKTWKKFMAYAYGLGAAIVILGALFKIMHWPGANFMLILGMGTEVFIFAVSAFEPIHKELDWSLVYPQLAEDYDTDIDQALESNELSAEEQLALAEQNMKKVELTPDLFTSLSGSLTGLKENVSKLAQIEDATVATNEYSRSVREASGKVAQLNNGFNSTVDAMSSLASTMGGAADNARAYHEQVQLVTRNLSSLNAVYEMELRDAEAHLKSLNQFYGSLAQAMSNMNAVAEDTEAYKSEVASLTRNVRALNKVYGGMLSAMSSGNA